MIQVLHKFFVREHLNKQHVCVLDRKKCPFVVQDWVWLKQIRLWTEKTLATDRKNCVIVGDSFSNVSFHSRPFSFLLRMIHDQKWTRFKRRPRNIRLCFFVLFFLFCLFSQRLFLRIKYEFDTINGLNPGVRFDCVV